MNKKYDVLIVGMGPSSIFTAYELIQLNRNKNSDRDRVVDDKYLIHTYKQIHDIFPTIIQDGTLHNCDELWIIFSEDAKQDKSIKEKYGGTAFKMYKKGNVFVIPNDIRAKLYNMINS